MRTLFVYTINTIKRNKNTSLSIMLAVLLASTLLCALCTYGYTQLRWQKEIEEYEDGQWHGEIGGDITSDKLPLVENNLNVAETMVKGPFSCLELSENAGLPYLLLRDADENYWNSMGEKNTLIEGRIPSAPGEIAVSKSFFEQNPGYRLGDTVTLPEGERRVFGEIPKAGNAEKEAEKRISGEMPETGNETGTKAGGQPESVLLEAGDVRRDGEVFFRTGERTVTLVGKMDMTTSTVVPGYYAMGYMDRSTLTGDEELVIYVKMRDIRKTYEAMPQIADALGIEKDEYGDYKNHFRYHARLLAYHFVFPPETGFSMENWGGVIVYAALLLLVMGAFVMIIRGAFQVSVSARIKQLGMFRSVGAAPGQIVASILMEGMILSAVPILLSMGIGYGFTVAVTEIYSDIAGEILYFPITVRFSPYLALLAAGLSLITVLISALLPALKVSRLSPLEAIRMQEADGGGSRRQRKGRHYPVLRRLFGYPGELAGASHYANRKGFRGGVMSLTLCLMLLTGFFVFISLNDYLSERNRSGVYYNISARLDLPTEADRELLTDILSVPGELEGTYYCVARMAYYASPGQESEEFKERGGFAGLDLDKWNLVNRDGRYRLRAYLYGMQEEMFDDYCRKLGHDPAEYYDTEKIRAIVLSAAPVYPEVVNNAPKSALSYSHLSISEGEELLLEEKTRDDMDTDYVLPVTAGAVATEEPDIGHAFNNYNLNLYVPLSVYYSVADKLSPEKAEQYCIYAEVKTESEEDIAVTERIRELCESVMAAEDVYITSIETERLNNAVGARAMGAVVDCIGILLVLIGISNTFSAVSHVMMRRRREFAMLRSVGMDNEGIGRLLFIEAFRMAVTPVVIGIFAVLILLGLMTGLLDVSWRELLPRLPFGKILLSILLVMAAVAASYLISAGRIKKDTIIEAVREENV